MVTAPLAMSISRRQNSSCDQCRKGKRACDAVWLRDRQQTQRARQDNGLGAAQQQQSPDLSSQGGMFTHNPSLPLHLHFGKHCSWGDGGADPLARDEVGCLAVAGDGRGH